MFKTWIYGSHLAPRQPARQCFHLNFLTYFCFFVDQKTLGPHNQRRAFGIFRHLRGTLSHLKNNILNLNPSPFCRFIHSLSLLILMSPYIKAKTMPTFSRHSFFHHFFSLYSVILLNNWRLLIPMNCAAFVILFWFADKTFDIYSFSNRRLDSL